MTLQEELKVAEYDLAVAEENYRAAEEKMAHAESWLVAARERVNKLKAELARGSA